jgi:hypothetical protein
MIVAYAPCTLPLRSEWTLLSSAVNGDFVCAHWRRS